MLLFNGVPFRADINKGGAAMMRLGRCGLRDRHAGSHEVVSLSDTFVLYLRMRSDYDFAIGIIVLRNHLLKVYAGHDHPNLWTEFR